MIERLKTFKASGHWFQNFMSRRKFTSMKPRGKEGFIDPDAIAQNQLRLSKIYAFWDVQDIVNTEEVGVLYRCFSNRTVCRMNYLTAFKPIKERLTAVLTDFYDGRKAPLVVIGKYKRSKSFPRKFDPLKDLGIHYYSQKTPVTPKSFGINNMPRLIEPLHRNVARFCI